MTDDNKVFKLIRRINTLIIFGVGSLIFILLAFATISIFNAETRRSTKNVVNVEQTEEIDETMELGSIREVKGTTFLQLPLKSKQRYSGSYSSKSTDSTRNYLYINSDNLEQNWLLDHNNHLIFDTDFLTKTKDKKIKNLAILYQIIKSDTDKDNRLDRDDLKTLALSHADGKNFTEVINSADEILGHTITENNLLVVIFNKNEKSHLMTINLSNFETVSQKELSFSTSKN